jgi:hypothetical protein
MARPALPKTSVYAQMLMLLCSWPQAAGNAVSFLQEHMAGGNHNGIATCCM